MFFMQCLKERNVICVFPPQCGSVRVDSVEDFAYGSEILVNTTDQVSPTLDLLALKRSDQTRYSYQLLLQYLSKSNKTTM